MSASTKIDLITFDSKTGEFALYLVESGPWPDESLPTRMEVLSQRIINSIEVVLAGLLGTKYPDSVGKPVRLQIDLHDEAPSEMYDLVNETRHAISVSEDLQGRIKESRFIKGMRIVTRDEMGRS